jgi:hypothetical protein
MHMKRGLILVGEQLGYNILSWRKYKGSTHMLLTVLFAIFSVFHVH